MFVLLSVRPPRSLHFWSEDFSQLRPKSLIYFFSGVFFFFFGGFKFYINHSPNLKLFRYHFNRRLISFSMASFLSTKLSFSVRQLHLRRYGSSIYVGHVNWKSAQTTTSPIIKHKAIGFVCRAFWMTLRLACVFVWCIDFHDCPPYIHLTSMSLLWKPSHITLYIKTLYAFDPLLLIEPGICLPQWRPCLDLFSRTVS